MKKYSEIPVHVILEALRLNNEGLVVWGDRPRSHFTTDASFKRFNSFLKGKEYGYQSGEYRYGSIRVGDKNKRLLYHVAKWVLVYGAYPIGVIDHKDGNGLNNNIDNLRDVGLEVNARNAKKRSDNSSGINGVHWHKRSKRWRAQGRAKDVHGNEIKLCAAFKSLDEALACRKEWEAACGNFSDRHGQ